jgi:DNA-binding response OmpR family regulator
LKRAGGVAPQGGEESSFLVVDEDEGVVRLLQVVLGGAGHVVHSLSTAEQAIVDLEHPYWDALVVEVQLPKMSGLELAARARLAHPGMPIVVMSADDAGGLEREAQRCGADAFISKPFSPRAFRAEVFGMVRQKSTTPQHS